MSWLITGTKVVKFISEKEDFSPLLFHNRCKNSASMAIMLLLLVCLIAAILFAIVGPKPTVCLERITDSKMQGRLSRTWERIVSRLLPVSYESCNPSTIQTENQKVHIITLNGSRTQKLSVSGKVSLRASELAAWTGLILTHQPSLPASKNTAPCKSPIMRKRYSTLASIRISPT